jgi:hypothetical protein
MFRCGEIGISSTFVPRLQLHCFRQPCRVPSRWTTYANSRGAAIVRGSSTEMRSAVLLKYVMERLGTHVHDFALVTRISG